MTDKTPPVRYPDESEKGYIKRLKLWAKGRNSQFAEHCRLGLISKTGSTKYRVGDMKK